MTKRMRIDTIKKNLEWDETMVLKEYTLQRAEYLKKFHFSLEQAVPELLWFEILDAGNIRKNTCLQVHTHTFYEIHFLYSGELSYKCGGKTIMLRGSRAVFIPPGVSHAYIGHDGNICKASLAFALRTNTVLKKEIQVFEFPEEIAQTTDFILNACGESTPLSDMIVLGRIYEILRIAFNCADVVMPAVAKTENDARVTVAKKFILKNFNRGITVSDVAKECCLSSKQLGRIFKQQTGASVFSYIANAKIKYSKRLLLNERISIKEISLMSGFENESGFISFFKRRCGIPPGLFRERYAEKK